MGDGRKVLASWNLLLFLYVVPAAPFCPSRCSCRDDSLAAACIQAGLEVVPIQLNPDVEFIDLSGNRIGNVDYTLSFYTSLKELNVSINKIQSLGSKNFESQGKLEVLNVSQNQIVSVGKDALRGLKLLLILDLSYNSIENLEHGSFRDTTSLKVIDLSHNKITSFEDSTVFKNLISLTTLNLNSNQIIDVPGELIRNLPLPCVLETITLTDNLIEVIEDKSFPSPCSSSIKFLTLGSNVIKNIEKSAFSPLQKLLLLDLSYNNLTFIPTQQLSKISTLNELDLSGNTFKEVKPVAFQSLFHLKTLRMSGVSNVDWIDSRAFVDNIRLTTVEMNDNSKLSRIPTRLFHGNHELRHISLSNNGLKTLDASHFPLDQLYTLDLSGNPLECNCSLHWLWTLVQPSKIERSLNDSKPLKVTANGLECSSPENLSGHRFSDIAESNVRCETTWLTVVVITGLVLGLFSGTCLVLLFMGSEWNFCPCTSEKLENDPEVDTRRLAAGLHASSGPPPILMLMPDKDYREAIMSNYPDMKLVEPWMNGQDQRHNDYSLNSAPSSKAQIVFV